MMLYLLLAWTVGAALMLSLTIYLLPRSDSPKARRVETMPFPRLAIAVFISWPVLALLFLTGRID